ncbi:MAG TPA: septum formation protein Maf [Chromatiales bacterium]|nr:septum formation protein Maf [Chromatiales bacterium]
MSQPVILLASTSRYRRALLQRLLVDFGCAAPDIDETARSDEAPAALAQRLAELKAESCASRNPGGITIGSDQVAALEDRILGKPGDFDTALAQLLASSGRVVEFHTAVCVLGPGDRHAARHIDLTRVHFRRFDRAEAERYLQREPAFDCAGSFKSEGFGVTLMQRIENQDPTALQGLPLIWLAGCLRDRGIALP